MATNPGFLRFASPGEQRCIAREVLGLYNCVVVGAIYTLPRDFGSPTQPEAFFHPLKRCAREHPFLSVIVRDIQTDKPFYEQVPTVQLSQHVSLLAPSDQNVTAAIQAALAPELDRPFPDGTPPWRIFVLPLKEPSSYFIAFAYSHVLGDGASGAAFHRTFLKAIAEGDSIKPGQNSETAPASLKLLAPPFDTPSRLPISWGFLLGPLIASFLPAFIARLFGIHDAASHVDNGTWTGGPNAQWGGNLATKIIVKEIEAPVLDNALRAARNHDTKLTAILQALIVGALSKAIPDPKITNFVSQTVLNMRPAVGISADQMGNMTSAAYPIYPRSKSQNSTFSDNDWAVARDATRELGENASRLRDQAIGLLRFVMSVRMWMLGKLGQRRECSFELSNLGAVDVGHYPDRPGAKITQIVFSQTASAISVPINFNFSAVKGGEGLIYTVTWQKGALNIAEHDEEDFVEGLCQSLSRGLENLR
ncbi:unnamed protein product [Clonostachys rosea f. rosea IK726]|uniref:Alcohol acetyltransferase n=2 Tax=Bionectria ochroleuca TaxID=29856 RepID=A0A0B7JWD1_BIOOC|nr:unnamed protein product [Clonostachys rosea f. rosea IK726]